MRTTNPWALQERAERGGNLVSTFELKRYAQNKLSVGTDYSPMPGNLMHFLSAVFMCLIREACHIASFVFGRSMTFVNEKLTFPHILQRTL